MEPKKTQSENDTLRLRKETPKKRLVIAQNARVRTGIKAGTGLSKKGHS